METIINDIFSLDREENRKTIQQYIEQIDEHKNRMGKQSFVQRKTILIHSKLLTLDRKIACG